MSYLNEEGPARIVFFSDGVVKIGDGIIGLFTSKNLRFGWIEILDPLIALSNPPYIKGKSHWFLSYFEMEFHPDEFILLVHHLESMRTVPVHESESIGYTTVRIENEELNERTIGCL